MDFKSQLNATVDVLKLLLIQENESITIDRARSLAQTDNTAGTSFFSTNPIWRQMIVEWYYSIIDQVGADRELVYIAMDILDRFLDVKTSYLKDKKEYEKAVIASLLISTKLYADEYICPKELLQLTSSSITSRDISWIQPAVDGYLRVLVLEPFHPH